MKDEKIIEKIKSTRHLYEEISIPEDLNEEIEKAIQKGSSKNNRKKKAHVKKNGSVRMGKFIGIAATLMIALFISGLNTSQAFAAAMEEIPVLGSISRVLTFRSYEEKDEDKTIVVEEPRIQQETNENAEDKTNAVDDMTETTENEEFVADINAQIEKVIASYKAEAEMHIAEYKEAFL